MTDNEIAEVLDNISILEKLLDENGALGKSFSDKVKSFDNFSKILPAPKNYDKYHSEKVFFEKNLSSEEYSSLEDYNKKYLIYKGELLHGFYRKLIKIGHERNQILHIDRYKINNYIQLKQDMQESIQFLKNRLQLFPLKNNMSFLENLDIKPKINIYNEVNKLINFNKNENITIDKNIQELFNIPLSRIAEKKQSSFSFQKPSISFNFLGVIINLYKMIISLVKGLFLGLVALVILSIQYWYVTLLIFIVIIPSFKNNNTQSYESSCSYYYVSAPKLNIREEANKDSKKVGKLSKNDFVCVEKESNNWSFIQDKGWVSSRYLSEYSVD